MRRFVLLAATLLTLPVASQAQVPLAEQIREIKPKVDRLLSEELAQQWYPKSVDRNAGGFHQEYARDWTSKPDANRFLVYQARMLWTASAYAEFSPTHKAEYAEYSRHGVDYLDRVMRDAENGGFHWILGPDGKLDPKLGDEKHVYGTAFALYAAAKAAEVFRDDRALKVARDAYRWLEDNAHDREHGGYFEALSRDGKPLRVWDSTLPLARRVDRLGVYYGFKSMNSHIHLLEAISQFYRVEHTPAVEARLREMLDVVRDKIAIEPGDLNLYLTRDWRGIPAHDSFGHDIETGFLLVEAAESLGMPDDRRTWKVARSLVDHALDWGWDDELGGFYDKGDSFNGKAYDTTKVWWTEAEGLNVLLLMHAKYGKETDRYGRAFVKQWRFIEKYQVDPEHGGWLPSVTKEGKPLGDGFKASQWKANYHTSRALMNVSKMIGELRDGPQPGR